MILCYPYKLILNLKHRMANVPVVYAAPPLMRPIFAAKADRLKPVV